MFSAPNYVGIWNDYLNFINFILFYPVVFTLYVWLPREIESIFNSIQTNEIIPATKSNKLLLIRFASYQEKILGNKTWFYLGGIGAILINIIVVFPLTSKYNVWWNQHTLTFISHHMFHILILFFVILSLTRIVQFIVLLNFLFGKVQIDIKALHPDGCGGLRALGSFSVKLGYVIGAIGASMIFVTYFQTYLIGGQLLDYIWAPSILLFFLVYSICAPLAFFAPLGTAHRAMREAKERELLLVSSQFEIDYQNMMKLLPSKANSLKKELDKIEQLKKLYKIVGDFPVWPFNYQNVLRFVVSVIGPFLLAILPSILSLIVK